MKNQYETYDEFKDHLSKNYLAKREEVLCGKVSKELSVQVRDLIGSERYSTLNDFVEEAVFEKMAGILWARINDGGFERGN